MTTATIRKSISYLTNEKGLKVAIQFDLKNKAVQDFVEGFIDTLDAIEAYKEPRTALATAKKDVLGY